MGILLIHFIDCQIVGTKRRVSEICLRSVCGDRRPGGRRIKDYKI